MLPPPSSIENTIREFEKIVTMQGLPWTDEVQNAVSQYIHQVPYGNHFSMLCQAYSLWMAENPPGCNGRGEGEKATHGRTGRGCGPAR